MDRAQLGREFRGFPVERDGGTASWLAAHFDIAPGYAVIPTRTDGLHRGFLGGEAGGVALDPVGFRFAIADLSLGEDPAQKAVAETRDGRSDARYFRNVDTSADYHKDITPANNQVAKS